MTDSIDPHTDSLTAALVRHGLELPPEQISALERYAQRLWEWNGRLNLTRHMTFEKFVVRDVTDSLQLANLLASQEHVLDVGTGGGVPGAVIAILRPDVRVALCDSVAKKAKAVAAIVEEAGIPATVHHARAEALVGMQRFDSLLIRAVAPLAKLLAWFKPHWGNIGRLLVIKGPQWVEERGEARHRGLFQGLQLRKLAAYSLVGSDSESVILQIEQSRTEEQARAE
ncbi:MAG TPA: 16S rRNA (guanine(527)-N(7))-methyltransferase RsmG [Pirellulales bacterium]|jgi:16S rRNA (guanine527-N7)-methyltransferase|nr:16S rRNA (guanine(527)-N(7))-methyltransferase RsmG [Pirellulales bacterium]